MIQERSDGKMLLGHVLGACSAGRYLLVFKLRQCRSNFEFSWPDPLFKWPDLRLNKKFGNLDSTQPDTSFHRYFCYRKISISQKLCFIATQHILNSGPDSGRLMHVRKFC